MDILSKKARSALMSKIKTRGTDIELSLNRSIRPLWKKERYRKNPKNLPGKPDVVFPKSRIAIFADGDFWHGRAFQKYRNKLSKFWKEKIRSNIMRDRQQVIALKKMGFKVMRFWGTEIKKNPEAIAGRIRKLIKAR